MGDRRGATFAAGATGCYRIDAAHLDAGYLRDLTRKAARGEFSLGPMLMALMRANQDAVRKAG